MEYYDYENELYHHGILGMKWGVRRFQNSDGSLKPAGEKRYGSGKSLGQTIKDHRTAARRKKNLAKARQAKVEKQKTAEERAKLIAKGKIRPKDMTTEELKQRIERLDAERRLKDLERQTFEASAGKKFIDTLMNKVITPAATSAGEQFLRKYLNDVGDDILGGLKDAKVKQDPNKRMLAEIEKLKNKKNKLELERDIKKLEKPEEKSLSERNRDKEEEIKEMYLNNPEYQKKKLLADIAKFDDKIKGRYDWTKDNDDDDRDKNNNGFDDDEEEKNKK